MLSNHLAWGVKVLKLTPSWHGSICGVFGNNSLQVLGVEKVAPDHLHRQVALLIFQKINE